MKAVAAKSRMFAVGVLVLAGCLLGCSPHSRYRVLSFLFDGVPNPAGENRTGNGNDSTMTRAEMDAIRQARRDSVARSVLITMHPPYADQECSTCHNLTPKGSESNGNSFAVMDFSSDSAEGFMVMPVEELCFECHDDMTEEAAEEEGLNIHPPVADGECIECHNPHRSPYPHLLRAARVRDLCFECHDEEIAEGVDDHPELDAEDSCTDCHDPHMSADEYLLM